MRMLVIRAPTWVGAEHGARQVFVDRDAEVEKGTELGHDGFLVI